MKIDSEKSSEQVTKNVGDGDFRTERENIKTDESKHTMWSAEVGTQDQLVESKASQSVDSKLAWLRGGVEALSPRQAPQLHATQRIASVEARILTKKLQSLLSGKLQTCSVEEACRYLVADHPNLSGDVLMKCIAPAVEKRDRFVDRMGPEPHFLIAAHVAYRMLAAGVGASEVDLFDDLVVELGRDVGIGLEDLRKIYPFIPSWPNGKKTESCLGFASSCASQSLDAMVWTEHFKHSLKELHEIPLTSTVLSRVHELRDERDMLKGCRLVEVAHGLAGKYPFLESLINVDGMRGKDITLLSKSYASTDRVIDVFRRVYGARVEMVEGREEVLSERAKEVIRENADECSAERAPLLLHLEGVHIWNWVDGYQKQHPELRMAGVSHTTSDSRDLQGGVGERASLPVVMMSTSEAKRNDEIQRFRRDCQWFVPTIGRALDATGFYEKRFLAVGYGGIMGPAAALAFRDLEYDYATYDTNPTRRSVAAADHHPVVDSLDGEKDRSVFVMVGVGDRAIGGEQLDGFEKGGIFVSVGTGRADIDVEWLEQKCRESGFTPEHLELPELRDKAVVLYRTLNSSGKVRKYYVVAGGYPANLGMPNPTLTEYSATTYVLASESLRQAKWLLDQGQSGTQPLDCIRIDVTEGAKPRRVISLFRRSGSEHPMRKIPYSKGGELPKVLDQFPDSPYFFKVYIDNEDPL